jgi:hypothetical protein
MHLRQRTKHVTALLFLLLFSSLAVLGATQAPARQARTTLAGKIADPPRGGRVGRSFPVTGTVKGQPRHLWLAVRKNELFWPQGTELTSKDGMWQGEVTESGSSGALAVVLIDVSDTVSGHFLQWLKQPNTTPFEGGGVKGSANITVLDEALLDFTPDGLNDNLVQHDGRKVFDTSEFYDVKYQGRDVSWDQAFALKAFGAIDVMPGVGFIVRGGTKLRAYAFPDGGFKSAIIGYEDGDTLMVRGQDRNGLSRLFTPRDRGMLTGDGGSARYGDRPLTDVEAHLFEAVGWTRETSMVRYRRPSSAYGPEQATGAAFRAEAEKQAGAIRTSSGLIYREVQPGIGVKPKPDDRVKVHIVLALVDGTVVVSTIKLAQPATILLSEVEPCWAEGIQLMSVGARARLVCPPHITFPSPDIPPGATTVVDVQLLEIVK